MDLALRDTDALLVIDMQRDFLPSTSDHAATLAVPGADQIIPGINHLATRFAHVILTQDWHPASHISFASTHNLEPYSGTIDAPYGKQTLWPDHCIQNTPGAELHPDLHIPHTELILRKGFRQHIDSYSAFTENDGTTHTGLAGYLRERGLKRLYFAGVAYDFCVGFSAIAAAKLGFEAIVLEDLTRAVNLPDTIATIEKTFSQLHIHRLPSTHLGL